MKSNLKSNLLTILCTILVIFNVLYFVIPFKHVDNFVYWFVYIITILSLLSIVLTYFVAFEKVKTLNSKILGYPLIKVGLMYIGSELIVALIFTLINAFIKVEPWILIVTYVLLIGVFTILFVTKKVVRDEIVKMENQVVEDKKFIKTLRKDMSIFVSTIVETSLKNKMNEALDIVKYSDPVSSKELEEIEDEINELYSLIKNKNLKNEYSDAITKTDKLISLLNERNLLCKDSKKR